MNPHLKSFAQSVLCAVLPTLFVVALTAFVSIPYSLGHHPGDTPLAAAATLAVAGFVLAALLAPAIAPYDPLALRS